MEDFREQHENCWDCAEYQTFKKSTDRCKKCNCFQCTYDRNKCLTAMYCFKNNINIISYY